MRLRYGVRIQFTPSGKSTASWLAASLTWSERAAAAAQKQDPLAGERSPPQPTRGEAVRISPQGTRHAGREAATQETTTPGGKAAGHQEAAGTPGSQSGLATGGGRTGAEGAEGAEEPAGVEGVAGGGPTS